MPESPRQADLAAIVVSAAPGAREVSGTLVGRALAFFPYPGGHAALAGVDLEARPGRVPWTVTVVDAAGGTRVARGTVTVRARSFPVQRLTLPKGQVDLDPETERRAEREAARLAALFAAASPERLWRGRFARPLPGGGSATAFGSRRIINGQPRMPHGGSDYAAERGTPVHAANRGRVALVDEFFFPGRFVALDHGLGLYTLYMHLERVDVAEGALVERGATIGAVGSSGRATGPHLHFGVQMGRARIDPESLLAAPLAD